MIGAIQLFIGCRQDKKVFFKSLSERLNLFQSWEASPPGRHSQRSLATPIQELPYSTNNTPLTVS
jgi:hypothetical protein